MYAKEARDIVNEMTKRSLKNLFEQIETLSTRTLTHIKDIRLTERQKNYLISTLGYAVNIQTPLGDVTLYRVEW